MRRSNVRVENGSSCELVSGLTCSGDRRHDVASAILSVNAVEALAEQILSSEGRHELRERGAVVEMIQAASFPHPLMAKAERVEDEFSIELIVQKPAPETSEPERPSSSRLLSNRLRSNRFRSKRRPSSQSRMNPSRWSQSRGLWFRRQWLRLSPTLSSISALTRHRSNRRARVCPANRFRIHPFLLSHESRIIARCA